MELRSLGTSEVKITPIIMGTWQAGKEMWVGIDDSETIEALRAAFEAGITTIDTAEYYGNGHSERIVGEALADVRDQVVYATKVFFQPSQVRSGHGGMPWLVEKPQNGLFGPLPDPLACWFMGH